MKDLYIQALEKFGNDAQISQLQEEMAELTIAINHFKRGRCDKSEVLNEIIDVIIMIEQMVVMFGFTEQEIELTESVKLQKLKNYLNEEAHKDIS